MVIVLIRTQLRAGADQTTYDALNVSMYEIVQRIPGFIGASGYSSPEGDLGVIRFESLESLRAWREHPDHLVVQQRGRSEFYASYTIEVCQVARTTTFDMTSGEPVQLPLRSP